MDDARWTELTRRFPAVPAALRVEAPARRTAAGVALEGASRPVIALTFSPDGRRIASTGGGLLKGPVEIRVFDVEARRLDRVCHGHVHGIFQLAWDPRTGLLASASDDFSVILWELERGDAIFLLGGPDVGVSRSGVAFSGTKLVVADGMTFGGVPACLRTVDLDRGDEEVLVELEDGLGFGTIRPVPGEAAVVVEATRIMRASDGEVRVVRVDGREPSRIHLRHLPYDLAPLTARVAVALGPRSLDDDEIELCALDLVTGARLRERSAGKDVVSGALALSPGGDRVAVAIDDAVELCAVDTLAPQRRLALGAEHACAVAWSPDASWLAIGTRERTLRLFDARSGQEHLG